MRIQLLILKIIESSSYILQKSFSQSDGISLGIEFLDTMQNGLKENNLTKHSLTISENLSWNYPGIKNKGSRNKYISYLENTWIKLTSEFMKNMPLISVDTEKKRIGLSFKSKININGRNIKRKCIVSDIFTFILNVDDNNMIKKIDGIWDSNSEKMRKCINRLKRAYVFNML
tara:strand:- start:9835 stop:10353 length:519 start_codon:yes stop_codon:yes gene_type:complete